MKTPILDEFTKAWILLVQLTGLPPPSYSVTRWWSRYEFWSSWWSHLVMLLHWRWWHFSSKCC